MFSISSCCCFAWISFLFFTFFWNLIWSFRNSSTVLGYDLDFDNLFLAALGWKTSFSFSIIALLILSRSKFLSFLATNLFCLSKNLLSLSSFFARGKYSSLWF